MTAQTGSQTFFVVPESTFALAVDPYEFIGKTCRRFQADLFLTRILLRKTICMSGAEAAAVFYDESKFQRGGAAPGRIQKSLFGRGGVQGLDDRQHRHRKSMFMSLVEPERVRHLVEIADFWWRTYAQRWAAMNQVVLYDELHEILTRSVCQWAGVPLHESEVKQRTYQMMALFQYAGSFGPKHWWARITRKQANRWAAGLIEQVRARRLQPSEHSAAHVIAAHRDLNGRLLCTHDAAVELLNVLRPTVAVSVYITFVALALHEHPACLRQVQLGDDEDVEMFVQEVRRFYPFFPFITARVRQDFYWKGYHFPRGRRVLIDIYGTNHDARSWQRPEAFRPERFRDCNGNLFRFIPQGGGNTDDTHRCPGEPIAVELMKHASVFLSTRIAYQLPEQNLAVERSKLPALPASRFVMCNVTFLG